jgi:hypothetical protein
VPLAAVALAVLALTAALVIGGAFWMGRTLATTTPHADRAPAPASSHAQAPTVSDAKPPAPAEPQAEETARPRRAPAHAEAPDPSGLVLSGIVEGLGDPYAVINGLIVGVGERVGDATLEQIAKGSVTLRHDDGRETVLRVPR